MRVNPQRAKYVLGLDLGRVQDYSALAILEREWTLRLPEDAQFVMEDMRPERATLLYRLRDLKRWKLGTPYTVIVADVATVMDDVRIHRYGGQLVVDCGGVGMAVLDELRAAGVMAVTGVVLTGGSAITQSSSDARVVNLPKKELVTPLVAAYQAGRLRVGRSVPQEFDQELRAFGYKLNKDTAHVSYESLSQQVHDDQVVAVALAYWWGERKAPMRNPLDDRVMSEVGADYDPREFV